MIGRWPRLLLLLSVCNTHIFFLSKVLSFAFALLTFFSLSLLLFVGVFDGGFSHLILPLLRHICFYNLFLPLKKASDDARRTLDQRKLFSPRSEWCYECSSSLSKLSSSQKEREKRSQHFHSKALESSVFFNQKRAVFCTKKKRKTIAKIKFSRVKHLRVSRRTTQQRKRRKEREREKV